MLQDPVRSGQSVVFEEGDVTVLGSVGSGAEIVAGGSIHIYGTLRGRALAGATGNSKARIFCHKIEAELLAIDGYYRTADDINASLRNRPVQAWLDGSTMNQRQAVLRWLWLWGPQAIIGVIPFVALFAWPLEILYGLFLLYTTSQSPKRQGYHDVQANSVVIKRVRA